jgi:hypothetical protein
MKPTTEKKPNPDFGKVNQCVVNVKTGKNRSRRDSMDHVAHCMKGKEDGLMMVVDSFEEINFSNELQDLNL